MNRHSLKTSGPSVRTMLEETTALLRRTPGSAYLAYYIGAVPFWLSLLYFVADMGQSGYAEQRLLPASLGVGALFLWGKAWECYFTSRLRDTLLRRSEEPWTPARTARMLLWQATYQPWGLILRFIAMVIMIPMGWILAFCHNLSVYGDGADHGGSPVKRAWKAACVWPWQALGVISSLGLFGSVVWLNVYYVFQHAPEALKRFFGVETMASRGESAFLNTTLLTASLAVTMLCVGPWWKAAFVLRCFYSDSLSTGADLRLALRGAAARSRGVATLLAALALAWAALAVPVRAETSPRGEPPAATVNPANLDQSIGDVLNRREYAWRVPRPPERQSEQEKRVVKWFDSISERISKFFRDLFHSSKDRREEPSGGGIELPWDTKIVVAIIAVAIAWIAWAGRKKWGRQPEVAAMAIAAAPNLESEDLAADLLPEAGWLQFARELTEKGEWRLALRAAYLAGLAQLGQRELLTIAKYKSNREYGLELRRRARTREELLAAFDENLLVFEGAWYGSHEVTPDVFSHFARNLERMKAC